MQILRPSPCPLPEGEVNVPQFQFIHSFAARRSRNQISTAETRRNSWKLGLRQYGRFGRLLKTKHNTLNAIAEQRDMKVDE
jgi:hypothetical protein